MLPDLYKDSGPVDTNQSYCASFGLDFEFYMTLQYIEMIWGLCEIEEFYMRKIDWGGGGEGIYIVVPSSKKRRLAL